MPTPAEYEAAGIYDPSSPRAAERLELLDWFASLGFTVDDMKAAAAEGQLISLAADRELLLRATHTFDDIATEAAIPREVLEKVVLASGFTPETARFNAAAIELFRQFNGARSLFSDQEALHFVRVMGSSLARIADAANSLFLIDVEGPLLAAGKSELELAQTQAVASQMLAEVSTTVAQLFRWHCDAAVRRSRDARRAGQHLEVVPMAIGFVDLVGYTSLTEAATTQELLSLLLEFEGRAYDIVTQQNGRVVKMIGDEVMFSAFSAREGATIALALVDALRERGDVAPRGGIAFGDVLAHGGDYYGSVVNLASRVADVAVPWEILVTETLAGHLDGCFTLQPAGRRMLKGFAEPVPLHSLTR